jgi:sulfate adenylyltransferase subunit 2
MLPVDELITKKREAVRYRLSGLSLAQVKSKTGLSVPTIIKAYNVFQKLGWKGLEPEVRGRKPSVESNTQRDNTAILNSLQKCTQSLRRFCSVDDLLDVYSQRYKPVSKKTLLRRLNWLVPECDYQALFDRVVDYVYPQGKILVLGFHPMKDLCVFYTRDRRGEKRFSLSLLEEAVSDLGQGLTEIMLVAQLDLLIRSTLDRSVADKPMYVVIKTDSLARFPMISAWQEKYKSQCVLLAQWALPEVDRPELENVEQTKQPKNETASKNTLSQTTITGLEVHSKMEPKGADMLLTHLQRLEAESIHIMREVVAEAENPVMLYSIGKDSAVMLHIAMKAFYPSLPPFPLLHVDTRWKFREMYDFRDKMMKSLGLELITHVNPDGIAKDINPFTHGSATHTDIMKTEGLKQALNEHKFDVAFGGARRDEEKSRAKERIFSFRTADHRWDPKNQRPEVWKQYNTRKNQGESIRVFPISNWTELDIWQYIHLENIPIVPLYYAKERPVVERDGTLIMVDDERMPLKKGEVPMMKSVRFRTLGCYPLTGAVESEADTLPSIIQEMLLTKTSERQGRMIDHDSTASMEKKKQEGYF